MSILCMIHDLWEQTVTYSKQVKNSEVDNKYIIIITVILWAHSKMGTSLSHSWVPTDCCLHKTHLESSIMHHKQAYNVR